MMSRSGGVAISIGLHWVSCVRDHGNLIDGHCIWVLMQIHDQLVGFLCVYAPIDVRLRVDLWQEIVDVLPSVDSWIVGGDFNNLEAPLDYHDDIPPHLRGITSVDIDAWDSFLFALQLLDAWHEQSSMHTKGTLDFLSGFCR